MGDLTITEDGVYPLKHGVRGDSGDRSILYASGNFGGAIAKLQYMNGKNDYVDLEYGSVETGKQYYIHPGLGVTLYLKVTGSGENTDIDVLFRGIS